MCLLVDALRPDEKREVIARRGYLNVVNPLFADRYYHLNLAVWDEREMAKILVHLVSDFIASLRNVYFFVVQIFHVSYRATTVDCTSAFCIRGIEARRYLYGGLFMDLVRLFSSPYVLGTATKTALPLVQAASIASQRELKWSRGIRQGESRAATRSDAWVA